MNIKKISFYINGDDRGQLVALEENKNIPFTIRRVYYMYDTGSDVVRGKHAHKSLQQVLICVNGSCTIVLDDGHERKEVKLDNPSEGLYLSHAIWREMKDFTKGTVLMVLADQLYDEGDYIRNYEDFLHYVGVK